MGMYRWNMLVAAAAAWMAVGCVAVPQQDKVKEVRICAAADCDAAAPKYTAAQLLAGVQQLLKANEGQKVTICGSDPKTRACESTGICFFVLGGILPGNACADSIVFSNVATGSQARQIDLKANMSRTFIWIPIACDSMTGTLAVNSPNEIYLEFQPHTCAWMVMGVFTGTFNFAVDSIDLKQGQVSGYWSQGVKGTGNGRGSGYAVLKFPKAMPLEESWFAEQPMPPASREPLSHAGP